MLKLCAPLTQLPVYAPGLPKSRVTPHVKATQLLAIAHLLRYTEGQPISSPVEQLCSTALPLHKGHSIVYVGRLQPHIQAVSAVSQSTVERHIGIMARLPLH